MNIYISTKDGLIHTNDKTYKINAWTEYGLTYNTIPTCYNDTKSEKIEIDNLLLIPNTHITNLWHFLHHVYTTYKYIVKNNIDGDQYPYFIFFKNFYNRQGDILKGQYNELLFRGLGLSLDKFEKLHKNFRNYDYIKVKHIRYVTDSINFQKEELFQDFKTTIIRNFGINILPKQITFILRRGNRTIINIDQVQKSLSSYNISYVYMEDISLKEQLSIAANTSIMIGVHGAGLSWCVFMEKNSKLIELYPGNSNTDNYIRWCNIANIKYSRMTVEKMSPGEFRSSNVKINESQLHTLKQQLN